MAHFAKLDENNTVTQVIVVANEELMVNGVESEQKGVDFCRALFGGVWKQTSYNGKFRKNYAGVGFSYDAARDAFVPPKPWASWVLNETTCLWEPPVPRPSDGKIHAWDEPTQQWIEVQV